ncbi:hypothetical protein BJ322DRAFT_442637 [Thelephora terrestris]|uniref:BTB domain-containing protein n=1 Tax=Thelephora terrestris TaxID=56493 RepID=A0A9P6L1W1_9AGAM|nr:hypothetical protein BJ322DRAFT_442637 [Thelephora terrestris]
MASNETRLPKRPVDMPATTALREALNNGVSTGNFVDTKFILYSHRDLSGNVCRPKALYANSHVLKTVPHFDDLLFGNFAESQSTDFKEAIDEKESAEDYGYLSDSDLEEDEIVSLFEPVVKPDVHPPDPFETPGEDDVFCEERQECVEKGKVVKIPDIAYVTFQAFLMYLYTNAIDFAPFGSQENRRSRCAEIVNPSHDEVPRPSPKSIYRLADKYDIPVLKTLALDRIRDELGECDIVEESFSIFASQYDEIRRLYVEQLAFTWMKDSTSGASRTSVDENIDSFVKGNLKHAAAAMAEFWEIANKDGEIKGRVATSKSNGEVVIMMSLSPGQGSLEMALIDSVRNGIFFDRKYWARHSKAGDLLKPVYLSSRVMGDEAQRMKELVKYVKGRNLLISDLEGEANVESDCEEDLPEAKGEAPNEERTRAVLAKGSFSAWRSLFFYLCTHEISFAPLKSQGIDSRLKYICEKTVADAPPPCSPKSIYVLASLLDIKPLRTSAFADFKCKLSVENVVDEVFSPVNATKK